MMIVWSKEKFQKAWEEKNEIKEIKTRIVARNNKGRTARTRVINGDTHKHIAFAWVVSVELGPNKGSKKWIG